MVPVTVWPPTTPVEKPTDGAHESRGCPDRGDQRRTVKPPVAGGPVRYQTGLSPAQFSPCRAARVAAPVHATRARKERPICNKSFRPPETGGKRRVALPCLPCIATGAAGAKNFGPLVQWAYRIGLACPSAIRLLTIPPACRPLPERRIEAAITAVRDIGEAAAHAHFSSCQNARRGGPYRHPPGALRHQERRSRLILYHVSAKRPIMPAPASRLARNGRYWRSQSAETRAQHRAKHHLVFSVQKG